jgi:DNA-binding transcriptional LysR family regulator
VQALKLQPLCARLSQGVIGCGRIEITSENMSAMSREHESTAATNPVAETRHDRGLSSKPRKLCARCVHASHPITRGPSAKPMGPRTAIRMGLESLGHMPLDPKQLANLLAVAEHGSFSRAAAARGISQPALSESIAQLERRLTAPVLDRGQRGSTLTPVGEILVRHARVVGAVLEEAEQELRLAKLGVHGPLRVGASPSVLLKFLPTVMTRLCSAIRELQISIVEGLDDELLPALLAGKLDIIVAPLAKTFPAPPAIAEEPLFEDPLALAVGPKSRLARRRIVDLESVADSPWVLPGPGSAYRRLIEALFTTAGLSWPANCVITNSLALVEALVAQSDRVSIVSRLQTDFHNMWRVRAIPLRGAPTRIVGIKWRRTTRLSPLAQRFVETCRICAKSGPLKSL